MPRQGSRVRREGEDYQAMKDAQALRDASQSPGAGRRALLGQGVVSEDVAKILAARKRSKFGNVKVTLDGIHFDSKREAERYRSLMDDVRAGAICCLEVHPRFPLVVHGQDCGYYEGDFSYIERGVAVVEDVKSPATRKLPTYRLKRKLVWALYGIEVREVS